MRGRTPGKRIAGVRLVTREGDIPGPGALLLRNVFRLLDSLPVCYLVGLLTVMFTEHHVRVGDLAAGTLLVMDHDSTASSFASTAGTRNGLSPQAVDLIQELLDRWPALDEQCVVADFPATTLVVRPLEGQRRRRPRGAGRGARSQGGDESCRCQNAAT
jgi:hypothetical protein